MANDSPAKSLVDIDLASLRVSALISHLFQTVVLRRASRLGFVVVCSSRLCILTPLFIVTMLPLFAARARV